MKWEVYTALEKSIRGAHRGSNEPLNKEMLRLAKYGITEKSHIVRHVAAQVLTALYSTGLKASPTSISEYEALLTSFFKSTDMKASLVTSAFGDLFAAILHSFQNPLPKSANDNLAMMGSSVLTVEEVLSLLPRLYLKAPSMEVKVVVFQGFSTLLKNLGVAFLEGNYPIIAKSLVLFASNTGVPHQEQAVLRDLICFILRETIAKSLSEVGQLLALKELCVLLKADGTPQQALIFLLTESGALLDELGPAASPAQEDMHDALLKIFSHTSQTVKISLAVCVRSFCLALPHHLNKLISRLVANIQKELPTLSPENTESLDILLGYGQILSALIRTVPQRPLFASYDDAAAIFSLSTQIIRSHGALKDFRIMSCQAQVAWTLIGALMTLGPNFVKVHVSQLLLMWKNVFSKMQPKDNINSRSNMETGYLLYSRDAAMAAMRSFIKFNSKELVTVDVSKRIVVCLNNSLQFLASIAAGSYSVSDPNSLMMAQKLYDRECHLRKRIFECFQDIQEVNYEAISSTILRAAIDAFAADPEKPDRFPVIRDIAMIEPIAATSLIDESEARVAMNCGAEERHISRLVSSDSESRLQNLVSCTIYRSLLNDPHYLYLGAAGLHAYDKDPHSDVSVDQLPPIAIVAVSDNSIELFSSLFASQNATSQETLMEQLIKAASYSGGKVTAIKRSAIQLNALTAVIGILKYATARRVTLGSGKVHVSIRDVATPFLKSNSAQLRFAACEIIGRLCRLNTNAMFVNPVIEMLVDQVVNNRDSYSRAGASLAMGSVYSYMGGMSAGSHLSTVVSILHSLAADAHPLVHTWALQGLYLTIESAGLSFGPFVKSTLSLIMTLYMSESHELAALQANGTICENQFVGPQFGRILYALVSVIGPELADSTNLRNSCVSLQHQLENDSDPLVLVESIRCIQNFIMFAPKYVDITIIIPFLQRQLSGRNPIIRKASVTCLYQLTLRDPSAVLDAALEKFEEQLFGSLDLEAEPMIRAEIKDIITALLKFSAPKHPSKWIDLFQSILAKTSAIALRAADNRESYDPDDPEGASRTNDDLNTKAAIGTLLLPRWRTQVFSLQCLRLLIETISASKIVEHLDLVKARAESIFKGSASDFLVFRVGDLITLAFNSSTAPVSDLRASGLSLLQDILNVFLPFI